MWKYFFASDFGSALRVFCDILTFVTVQFCSVPIHVVLFVENFEDGVFPERQLVVRTGAEVVFGYRLHRPSLHQLESR